MEHSRRYLSISQSAQTYARPGKVSEGTCTGALLVEAAAQHKPCGINIRRIYVYVDVCKYM